MEPNQGPKPNKRPKLEKSHFSWRNRPGIFRDSIKQRADICWAIAVIRQLEALFRLKGGKYRRLCLSVQELLNLIPKKFDEPNLLSPSGVISNIFGVIECLLFGTLAEKDCPLTYNCTTSERKTDKQRYKAVSAEVEYLGDYQKLHPGYYSLLFEHLLQSYLLDVGPVAVRMNMYRSYDYADPKGIFAPGKHEKPAWTGHYVLLTGFGVDDDGVEYWEAQDSRGNNWGDKGFFRLARGADLITHFVRMFV